MNIFLSYSHKDLSTAERICYAIRGLGHSVFFDKHNLPAGFDYNSIIKPRVDQSDAFVFLISPNSTAKGRYALSELECAKSKWPSPSGRVLPVMIERTNLDLVDNYLRAVTILSPKGDLAFEAVWLELKDLLRKLKPLLSAEDVTFDNLSRASNDEIHEIICKARRVIAEKPTDGMAHYILGHCYLHVKKYSLAVTSFKNSVELLHDHADTYYYYGLSLIGGRRFSKLTLKEIRFIEELLQVAMQWDDKAATYYYLAAIIKYEYYLTNGLLCSPLSPEELIIKAHEKEHVAGEVGRLLENVHLNDEALFAMIRM